MIRVAIINHETHQLFIEDICDADIEEYGSEEEYIKDNYYLEGEWSWDYIVHCEYYGEDDKDGIEVEFTELV